MANTYNGNTFYISAASSAAGSYVDDKSVEVVGIIYAFGTAGDEIELNDLSSVNGTVGAGDQKIHLHGQTKDIGFMDLSNYPLRFPNGLWVSTCTSGTNATLIINRKG